jgi:hypothetical protein
MTREMKSEVLQGQMIGATTYSAVAARGSILADTYNAQSLKTPLTQAQREVTVNIRTIPYPKPAYSEPTQSKSLCKASYGVKRKRKHSTRTHSLLEPAQERRSKY